MMQIKKIIQSKKLKYLKQIYHFLRRVKNIIQANFEVYNIFHKSQKHTKRIIYLLICEHGNIGDQAIVAGTNRFFSHYFGNITKIDIPSRVWEYAKNAIKKHICQSDILIVHGGGYFGTLWFFGELQCREIITAFPNNKIICFPQTIFFEKTPCGLQEIQNTKSVWEKHEHLYVCVREQQSYDFCKKYFTKNSYYLIPDIVLYMKEQQNIKRDGILLCFRSDKEKITPAATLEHMRGYLIEKNFKVHLTDMVQPYMVSFNMREVEVQKKLNEFRSAKLVITDRLHAMIFSAITGTPCVALNNISKKVEGVYQWLKYLDYIKFAQNISEALSMTESLLNADLNLVWDNEPLMTYYEKLADIINK